MEAEEPLSAKRWVRAAVEQILTFLPDGIDLVVVRGKKIKNKKSADSSTAAGECESCLGLCHRSEELERFICATKTCF